MIHFQPVPSRCHHWFHLITLRFIRIPLVFIATELPIFRCNGLRRSESLFFFSSFFKFSEFVKFLKFSSFFSFFFFLNRKQTIFSYDWPYSNPSIGLCYPEFGVGSPSITPQVSPYFPYPTSMNSVNPGGFVDDWRFGAVHSDFSSSFMTNSSSGPLPTGGVPEWSGGLINDTIWIKKFGKSIMFVFLNKKSCLGIGRRREKWTWKLSI